MKIYIRGGIWTNVEDQVLLAAFMKYGGNQWLRIASLLPRKTAQQVKARWEEYLDPTLRKTPWTHREDEKLLHLARLMPMQWRTIAQYFGRSAYQCVERFRELVDKASATPHYDDNDAAVVHSMMPNFETLNAVPDSVELEQDQKEMLAEARARLANTQGKKARRKARERQLNVMRKIIALRKKRELEAAGIILEEKNMWEDEEFELDVVTTHMSKKVKFDTKDDDEIAKKERVNRIKKKVEERKKKRQIAQTLSQVKEELKKEEAKLDLPFDNRHTSLMMPEPQIGDSELKSIELLRHNNSDFFEQPRGLSLTRRAKHVEEAWNPEPEIEEDEYKTQAVQMNLPRPYPVSTTVIFNAQEEADRLIVEESVFLAYRDARKFPPSQVKTPLSLIYPQNKKAEEYFSHFSDMSQIALFDAQKLIDDEIAGQSPDIDSFIEQWEALNKEDETVYFDLDEKIRKKEEKVTKLREFYHKKTLESNETSTLLLQLLNKELVNLHTLARNRSLYSEYQSIEQKTLEARFENLSLHIDQLRSKLITLDAEYKRVLQEKKLAQRNARKEKKQSKEINLMSYYDDGNMEI